MRERRAHVASSTNGPGKLTQALGIELTENDTSLVDGPIRIHEGERLPYVTGVRIGITKAAELPWRFCARRLARRLAALAARADAGGA